MAFPQVTTKGTVYDTGQRVPAQAYDTHPIAVPTGVASGDLLITTVSIDGRTGTVPSMTGFTTLVEGPHSTGSNRIWAGYKIADGTESGTIDLTTAIEHCTGQMWRITGWHGTTPPEADTAEGNSVNANSPSLSPSWGSADTLWISFFGINGGTGGVTVWAYADNQVEENTGGSGSCGWAISTDEIAAATEDPGAYTHSTQTWVAATIAVRPAAGGVQGFGRLAQGVTARGAGTKVANGNGRLAQSVTARGAGIKVASGDGRLAQAVAPRGVGEVVTAAIQGFGRLALSVTLRGAGTKVANGNGRLGQGVTARGAGTKVANGNGRLGQSVTARGAGAKVALAGGRLAQAVAPRGVGEVVGGAIQGFGRLALSVTLRGAGSKVAAGGGAQPLGVAGRATPRKVAAGGGRQGTTVTMRVLAAKLALAGGRLLGAVTGRQAPPPPLDPTPLGSRHEAQPLLVHEAQPLLVHEAGPVTAHEASSLS